MSAANRARVTIERITVTRVTLTTGCGRDGHGMVRTITQVWDDDGRLIAENDPADEWYEEQNQRLAVDLSRSMGTTP